MLRGPSVRATPAGARAAGQTAAIDDLSGARAFHPSKLTARFSSLVAAGPPSGRLDEVCAVLAAHFQLGDGADGTDTGEVVARLDGLAAGVGEASLAGIVEHLIRLGFSGRPADYQSHESSLLPAVLRRRRGLPILLGVVGVEVGRRLDVPVRLIGMPGHVLLGTVEEPARVGEPAAIPTSLADPFNSRPTISVAEARALFVGIHGSSQGWSTSLLRPMSERAVVARMLTNLAHRFRVESRGRAEALALSLRCRVAGTGPMERLDMAQAMGRSGAFDQAAAEFDGLAALGLQGELEPGRLKALAQACRARLN